MQDEIQIKAASQTLKRMATDPISWIPFLPFAAAYSFLGAPWWACAAGAALAAGGVVAWWRKHWSPLYRSSEVEILKEQAAADNLRIEKAIKTASAHAEIKSHRTLTQELPSFLVHKRFIETSIFEDNLVTTVESEIATMITDLSKAWINDLEKLQGGNLTEKENARLREAIGKGLAVIKRTSDEIDILIRPAHGLQPVLESVAAERAQRLDDRIEEARSIRDRLVRDLKNEEDLQGGNTEKIIQ